MRRLRGEGERISVRLAAEDRLEAERRARLVGQRLSDYVREAIREKNARAGA